MKHYNDYISKEGKRFRIGYNYMAEVVDWCKNNIDPDNWVYARFENFLYVRLYDMDDIIIFRLKFASMITPMGI